MNLSSQPRILFSSGATAKWFCMWNSFTDITNEMKTAQNLDVKARVIQPKFVQAKSYSTKAQFKWTPVLCISSTKKWFQKTNSRISEEGSFCLVPCKTVHQRFDSAKLSSDRLYIIKRSKWHKFTKLCRRLKPHGQRKTCPMIRRQWLASVKASGTCLHTLQIFKTVWECSCFSFP